LVLEVKAEDSPHALGLDFVHYQALPDRVHIVAQHRHPTDVLAPAAAGVHLVARSFSN
jgi:hypothetical protein